jgi:hypothetical protein
MENIREVTRRERARRAALTPEQRAAENAAANAEVAEQAEQARVATMAERAAAAERDAAAAQREATRRAALTQEERNAENAMMRNFFAAEDAAVAARLAAFNAETARIAALPQEQREIAGRDRFQILGQRIEGPRGPRVDCMEVHRVSATFKDKLPLVAVVIREDLGAGPQHPSFIEHLDATVGKCVRESPLFESKKKPNSSEVRTRETKP